MAQCGKSIKLFGLESSVFPAKICITLFVHIMCLYFISNLRQSLESLEVNVEMEKKNKIIK